MRLAESEKAQMTRRERKHLQEELLRQQVDSTHEHQPPAQGPAQPTPQIVVNSKLDLPPAIAEYYNAKNQSRKIKSRWDQARFWLEVAGFIVLGLYVIATWRTLDQIKQQTPAIQGTLTEMQRATDIQERPWLSIEAVPENGLIFVNGDQPVLKLKFSIRNVGHSIAKGIQVDAKMFPSAASMPIAIDAGERQRELCDHLKINQVGLFDLFPINEPVIQELDISTSANDVERQSTSIRGSNSRKFVSLYVVGCATYRSSFSPVFHQTRFSYHLIGPGRFDKDGKPLVASDGMFLMGVFEVGVSVPNNKLGIWQEVFGQNEAN